MATADNLLLNRTTTRSIDNKPFYLEGDERYGHHACLLMHGLGGGVYEMKLLGYHLHAQGFSVQGINYPGHDKPAQRMPGSRWEEWLEHSHDTYEALAKNHDSVSLVGFSTGCPLALRLAHVNAAEGTIDKLILLSPFFKIKSEWYYMLPPEQYIDSALRFTEIIPRFGLPIHDPDMLKLARETAYLKTFNLTAVQSALELIADVRERLPEITNPALIIQSQRDRVVCPTGASYLMDHLGSANKELIWLNQSNHVITMDLERQRVMDHVGEFIQSAAAPAEYHVRD